MPAPISATMWSPPAEAGTLTGSPRVSDLPTTAQPAGPKRAFTSAILVALGIVCVVAAGLIGSLAFPGRTPKTTVNAAAIPAAVAPDDPAPPSTPPLPATAVAIEPSTVAPPPVKTSAPAATTAPSGKATPVAAPPIVVPPIKSCSRSPPAPPPKKANPALGF